MTLPPGSTLKETYAAAEQARALFDGVSLAGWRELGDARFDKSLLTAMIVSVEQSRAAATVVDSGYVTHAAQTVELVRSALDGRRLRSVGGSTRVSLSPSTNRMPPRIVPTVLKTSVAIV